MPAKCASLAGEKKGQAWGDRCRRVMSAQSLRAAFANDLEPRDEIASGAPDHAGALRQVARDRHCSGVAEIGGSVAPLETATRHRPPSARNAAVRRAPKAAGCAVGAPAQTSARRLRRLLDHDWALVPEKPKALTPASRRPSALAGNGGIGRCDRDAGMTQSTCGLPLVKVQAGRDRRRLQSEDAPWPRRRAQPPPRCDRCWS